MFSNFSLIIATCQKIRCVHMPQCEHIPTVPSMSAHKKEVQLFVRNLYCISTSTNIDTSSPLVWLEIRKFLIRSLSFPFESLPLLIGNFSRLLHHLPKTRAPDEMVRNHTCASFMSVGCSIHMQITTNWKRTIGERLVQPKPFLGNWKLFGS
jgi:hypothetical protein